MAETPEKNPEEYVLDSELCSLIWVGLFESGHHELARVLSNTMIEQGCQELEGTKDKSLILMFWKNFLEDNNIVAFQDEDEELH